MTAGSDHLLEDCLHELNNVFTSLEIHATSARGAGTSAASGAAIRAALQRGRETLSRVQQLLLDPESRRSHASPDVPGEAPGRNHAGLCILLVEDNPEVRDSLCELLSTWGCLVSTARSTAEAEVLFRRQDRQLAIIDVQLDGRSGIGLSVRLRRTQPRCRILLISGAPLTPEARAIADLVLEKPISPLQLRGALQALFPD